MSLIEPCLLAGNAGIAWTALAATVAIACGIGRQAGTIAHRLTATDRATSETRTDVAHGRLAMLAAIAASIALFKAAGCSMHDAYTYATCGSIGAISAYSLWILWMHHLVKPDA